MNTGRAYVIAIFVLAMVFAIPVCMAEERSDYLLYLQGEKGVISGAENNTMILAISDMVPYYHIQTKERNYLMPITGISGFSLPINAALVLHDNEGETVFMVKIVKMTTEEGNGEVVLWMQPLDFYEGALLNTFTGAKKEFNPEFLKDSIMIGIYGEIPDRVPENRGEREWVPEPLTGNDYSFMDSSCRKICSESCPSCYDECYQGCTRWPRFNYSYEGYRRSLPSCCKNPPLQ